MPTMENGEDRNPPSDTRLLGDEEFLNYCTLQAGHSHCELTPAQTFRLLTLAGMHSSAKTFRTMSRTVLFHQSDAVREVITTARRRVIERRLKERILIND